MRGDPGFRRSLPVGTATGPGGGLQVLATAYIAFFLLGWTMALVPTLVRVIEGEFGQADAGMGFLFLLNALSYAAGALISTGRPRDESRGGHLVEEMERLAALREQGSLSDEEFAGAKQRLLR